MDIRLLRGWMYDRVNRANKTLKEKFKSGVYEFIDHAMSVPGLVSSTNEIRCPCRKCGNKKYIKCDVVVVHLCKGGFREDYWYWTSHGEVDPASNNNNVEASSSGHFFHTEGNNRYEDLVHDAMRDAVQFFENTEGSDIPNAEYQRFHELLTAAQTPLFPGSEEFALSFSLKLMTIKAECNMSQSCYDRVSNLFKNSYPEENYVPESFYEAKKLISKLGLTSVKIDCCINGCMLYYKEDVHLQTCKFCNESRFKSGKRNKQIPRKKMHYLPLIPRLKRLYASHQSAPHMRWHFENKREEGVMCHPSDGKAWKNFDESHPDFAADPRNVRLGLCTDGPI